jgi:hypothetical protein
VPSTARDPSKALDRRSVLKHNPGHIVEINLAANSESAPVAIVQRQVDAYNRRDLPAFLATYSEGIRLYRMPSSEPALAGKAAFAEFYRTQRFNLPALRAEILQRIVIGNKVIDHERISGLAEQPIEAVAAYEVVDGLIDRVWFFYP